MRRWIVFNAEPAWDQRGSCSLEQRATIVFLLGEDILVSPNTFSDIVPTIRQDAVMDKEKSGNGSRAQP